MSNIPISRYLGIIFIARIAEVKLVEAPGGHFDIMQGGKVRRSPDTASESWSHVESAGLRHKHQRTA